MQTLSLEDKLDDVTQLCLQWKWRQDNVLGELARAPEIREFDEMNAGLGAFVSIAAGYAKTGDSLKEVDVFCTDSLLDPEAANLEPASEARGGGSYTHFLPSPVSAPIPAPTPALGAAPLPAPDPAPAPAAAPAPAPSSAKGKFVRTGKAKVIPNRQDGSGQHDDAAELNNLSVLSSPLYPLYAKRDAKGRSAFCLAAFEDLRVYALLEMTNEGQKRVEELHYFPGA